MAHIDRTTDLAPPRSHHRSRSTPPAPRSHPRPPAPRPLCDPARPSPAATLTSPAPSRPLPSARHTHAPVERPPRAGSQGVPFASPAFARVTACLRAIPLAPSRLPVRSHAHPSLDASARSHTRHRARRDARHGPGRHTAPPRAHRPQPRPSSPCTRRARTRARLSRRGHPPAGVLRAGSLRAAVPPRPGARLPPPAARRVPSVSTAAAFPPR